MGIYKFWKVISEEKHSKVGEGKLITLADWSSAFFKDHGRPLRIAIDEPYWRFHNLSDSQVASIRKKSPLSKPRERNVMNRLYTLLQLNIDVIFVLDGPNKPGKRRHGGLQRATNSGNTADLLALLKHLHVPFHHAPAEAEAECARMQSLGVVDAVWTDDSDALMFGCTELVRFGAIASTDTQNGKGKVGLTKHDGTVNLLSFADVHEHTGLTRAGITLFALLAGNDYDAGITGCGDGLALRAAATETGLGDMLVHLSQADLPLFRAHLAKFFKAVKAEPGSRFKGVEVPSAFPKWNVVQQLVRPRVSSNETLRSLPCLSKEWMPSYSPNLPDIITFLVSNFNSNRKSFPTTWPIKYLVQIELNGRLRETSPEEQHTNRRFGVVIQPRKPSSATTTITVDPFKVFPNVGILYGREVQDTIEPIHFDLLTVVLEQGLPAAAFPKIDELEAPNSTVAQDGAGAKRGRGRPKKAEAAKRTDTSGNEPQTTAPRRKRPAEETVQAASGGKRPRGRPKKTANSSSAALEGVLSSTRPPLATLSANAQTSKPLAKGSSRAGKLLCLGDQPEQPGMSDDKRVAAFTTSAKGHTNMASPAQRRTQVNSEFEYGNDEVPSIEEILRVNEV